MFESYSSKKTLFKSSLLTQWLLSSNFAHCFFHKIKVFVEVPLVI